MSKNICFIIDNVELYLEKVLVDYNDVPIFFLCKGNDCYYIALCVDFDELSYIVEKVSLTDVYDLLHGKTAMRDVIKKQCQYWEIISGADITSDEITQHKICEINDSLLPEENAKFQALTEDMKQYVENFDDKFFKTEFLKVENIDVLNDLIGEINGNENIDKEIIDAQVNIDLNIQISEMSFTKSFFKTDFEECEIKKESELRIDIDMKKLCENWLSEESINVAA